jgi:hypothetical protein
VRGAAAAARPQAGGWLADPNALISKACFDWVAGGLEPPEYASEWGAGLSLRPAGGDRARQFRRVADAARAGDSPLEPSAGSAFGEAVVL